MYCILPLRVKKVQAHHLCNTSKNIESNVTLIILPVKNEPILVCYKELYQRLETLSLYELLFLNDPSKSV